MIGPSLAWLADARAPAGPIAVARAVAGVAALLQLRLAQSTFDRYLDPGRIHFPNVAWLPGPSARTAPFILGAWFVAAVCFVVGLRTRLAGGLLAGILLWSVLYDEQTYENHVYLLGLVVFLLTLAHAGAALSLDAGLRVVDATAPAWAVFLLNAQLSIVYGFAAINKLNGDFLAGGVMLRNVKPLHTLESVIGYRPMLAVALLLAWGAVLMEGWLAVAMWSAKWRPSAIAIGLLLHAGINTTMGRYVGLGVFTLTMWALYLPFLDARPASRTVTWDRTCSACTVWVRWLRRLDWMGVHQFRAATDPETLTPMGEAPDGAAALQLIGPEGRHTGIAAVGRVLELLPVSYLWAPFLRLAPVRRVGERVYLRYAGRRRIPLTARGARN